MLLFPSTACDGEIVHPITFSKGNVISIAHLGISVEATLRKCWGFPVTPFTNSVDQLSTKITLSLKASFPFAERGDSDAANTL